MSNTQLALTEFADNPEPRCAVVLLLDTSGSMEGDAIAELNEGLRAFEQALKSDRLASLRVEVAVVAFGGSARALDVRSGSESPVFDANAAFVTVDRFDAPTLRAHGGTPMGEAVRQGITLLRQRKEVYKQNGIDYFRPWMFLISDGEPTDEWLSAAAQVQQEEARKGLSFYAVAVRKANVQTLGRFSTLRPPLSLKGLAFSELFEWLSRSLSVVSQSKPGEQVPLPAVDGWATFESGH
ncbi:MAG: VWA domain-containing protein [Chloroflexi bacterium]|nr:VWA domain-containing protein [Chloroflexota bacterium]